MLEVATKRGGERFGADELATYKSIDHGMGCVEFMVFCDENPLPIVCECPGGCGEVSEHNGRVRTEHPDAYERFVLSGSRR